MNKSAKVANTRAAATAATAAVAAATAFVMMGNVVSAAPVGPIDPVQATEGFLVMTEGNATLIGTENEGTLAVGGNLAFGQYQLAVVSAGNFFAPGDNLPTALVVDGQVDFANSVASTRLQVLQNGYAKIGNLNDTFVRNVDTNNAPANTRILPINSYDASPRIELVTSQPETSVGPVSVIDFAEAFQTFRSNSTELATCQNTVVLRDPNGDPISSPIPPRTNAVINLSANTTNVLNINSTDLDNIGILTFADQPTADRPLLVNVNTTDAGDTFDWIAPNFARASAGPKPASSCSTFPPPPPSPSRPAGPRSKERSTRRGPTSPILIRATPKAASSRAPWSTAAGKSTTTPSARRSPVTVLPRRPARPPHRPARRPPIRR